MPGDLSENWSRGLHDAIGLSLPDMASAYAASMRRGGYQIAWYPFTFCSAGDGYLYVAFYDGIVERTEHIASGRMEALIGAGNIVLGIRFPGWMTKLRANEVGCPSV